MSADSISSPYLTVHEVAEMFRLSNMTVYRMIHTHELPAVQFGRSYRVSRSAAMRYIEHATVEGTPEHGEHGGHGEPRSEGGSAGQPGDEKGPED